MRLRKNAYLGCGPRALRLFSSSRCSGTSSFSRSTDLNWSQKVSHRHSNTYMETFRRPGVPEARFCCVGFGIIQRSMADFPQMPTITTTEATEALITTLRGSSWARYSAAKRSFILNEVFRYWRSHGFPYHQVTERQLKQEFSRLIAKDWRAVFDGTELRASNVGLRLANSFQPDMWKAKVNRYRSPVEIFNDDNLLRCAIERSLRIWPDRFGANPSCLRRMLKSYPGAAGVSNYRPMIARAVITKYSHNRSQVLDFSAGYGGRLLGALAAGRRYVGIEPNRAQVRGMKRMVRAIVAAQFSIPDVEIINGCAEQELPRIASRSVDLVFSSPPFFNWEHYSQSHQQSFRRYPTYESWKEHFLQPVITQSFRVLDRDGYLILNVSNGNRLPSSKDVADTARREGFTLTSIRHMTFPKLPYLHPRDGTAVKKELLLVFRKVSIRRCQ